MSKLVWDEAAWEQMSNRFTKDLSKIPKVEQPLPADTNQTIFYASKLRTELVPLLIAWKTQHSKLIRYLKVLTEQLKYAIRTNNTPGVKLTEGAIDTQVSVAIDDALVPGLKIKVRDAIDIAESRVIFLEAMIRELKDIREEAAIQTGLLKVDAGIDSTIFSKVS